ncbi:MAG TPA: nitroreductase family protein [Parvularcula sp.]|nr:nitroreductase family protein [Parvularcula sp.]
MTKSASDLIRTRISTRAFLPDPVSEAEIRAILDIAKFAPSGGNLQPWKVHVVTGAARDRLVAAVLKAIAENPFADEAELKVYPDNLWEPHRTRRFTVGEQMYALLGIPREDKMARLMNLRKNFEFFGAPAGLFFTLDRRFDKGQWAHLGMFMQSIALVAEERGLATCMQEAWTTRARTVCNLLGIPDTEQFYCGMALGYADRSAPVNRLRSSRAPLEDFVTFHKD